VRLARSVGCLFARKVAHACKIVSSTIAKIDGAINSAEATMCTRTSNTLRNTLLKKLVLRPSARLWRGLRTTQTPSFAKRRTFRVLSRCGIHAHAITSAYVCENAATVVENSSTRRTHFTMRRRASDVEGATRTAIRSEIHFVTCSCAHATPGARARHDSSVKVTGMRDGPCDFKKKDERAPDSRFSSTVGRVTNVGLKCVK